MTHNKKRAQPAEERHEREQKKKQERQKLQGRLNDFGVEFFEELPAAWVGPQGLAYALRVEYGGRIYQIEEVKPGAEGTGK